MLSPPNSIIVLATILSLEIASFFFATGDSIASNFLEKASLHFLL
jgi:hypothetical protein